MNTNQENPNPIEQRRITDDDNDELPSLDTISRNTTNVTTIPNEEMEQNSFDTPEPDHIDSNENEERHTRIEEMPVEASSVDLHVDEQSEPDEEPAIADEIIIGGLAADAMPTLRLTLASLEDAMKNTIVNEYKCLKTIEDRETLSRVAKDYQLDKKLLKASDRKIDDIRRAILEKVPEDQYKGTHMHDNEP